MFEYNGQTYDKIWFTADEHYGSERALSFSYRLDYGNSIRYGKSTRLYEDYLEKSGLSESQQKALLRNATNTVYGKCIDRTSVDTMNNDLICKSNLRVMNTDLVFHIGDFGDYMYSHKLIGSHILIMGNYEYNDCIKDFNNDFSKFRQYIIDNYNFIDVIERIQINIDKVDIFKSIKNTVGLIDVTHKPTDCTFNWVKNECCQTPDGRLFMNLFGHIHEKSKIKKFGINVGVDCHHFYPMSQEEVDFYLYSIIAAYDDDVFC